MENKSGFLSRVVKLIVRCNESRFSRIVLSISLGVILLGSTGPVRLMTFVSSSQAVDNPDTKVLDQAITPLQRQIREMIDNMTNQGKPHPDVTFESFTERNSTGSISSFSSSPEIMTTTKARTVLEFSSPTEAGQSRWDDIIINSSDESVREQLLLKGNLTQMIIDKNPELYGPDGLYTYGHEPRMLVLEETISVVSARQSAESAGLNSLHSTSTSTTSNIVMGFTFIKSFDYTIGFKWKVGPCPFCVTLVESRAGFAMDLNLGLRLPVEVKVTTPNVLNGNQQYTFNTAITPADFSAEDYEQLGIPPLNGNEAIANFSMFLGIKVTVIGYPIIDWALDPNIDIIRLCSEQSGNDCGNFVTPFGVDENGNPREFPLPDILVSPDLTGLKFDIGIFSIGAGLKIDPDFGSDKITADWSANESGEGNGEVIYTAASPASFDFGPVKTHAFDYHPNASNIVELSLDNYKYHLTRQSVTISYNIQLTVFRFHFDTSYRDLLSFELSDILGEPAIGQHEGTDGVTVKIPIAQTKEICDDGIDNDDDGLIDRSDPDCIKVGGEVIGIDMTTLFVAGAFANTWTIPIAGTMVAGIIGLVLKRRLSRD